jgi:hypothetical protein
VFRFLEEILLRIIIQIPTEYISILTCTYDMSIILIYGYIPYRSCMSLQHSGCLIVDAVVDYYVTSIVRHQVMPTWTVLHNPTVTETHFLQDEEWISQDGKYLEPIRETHSQEYTEWVQSHTQWLLLEVLRYYTSLLIWFILIVVPNLYLIILRTSGKYLFSYCTWNAVDSLVMESSSEERLDRRDLSIQLERI